MDYALYVIQRNEITLCSGHTNSAFKSCLYASYNNTQHVFHKTSKQNRILGERSSLTFNQISERVLCSEVAPIQQKSPCDAFTSETDSTILAAQVKQARRSVLSNFLCQKKPFITSTLFYSGRTSRPRPALSVRRPLLRQNNIPFSLPRNLYSSALAGQIKSSFR